MNDTGTTTTDNCDCTFAKMYKMKVFILNKHLYYRYQFTRERLSCTFVYIDGDLIQLLRHIIAYEKQNCFALVEKARVIVFAFLEWEIITAGLIAGGIIWSYCM